jgi:hypothetical protein
MRVVVSLLYETTQLLRIHPLRVGSDASLFGPFWVGVGSNPESGPFSLAEEYITTVSRRKIVWGGQLLLPLLLSLMQSCTSTLGFRKKPLINH